MAGDSSLVDQTAEEEARKYRESGGRLGDKTPPKSKPDHSKTDAVTLARQAQQDQSRTDAQRKAAQTLIPQPVTDNAGKILYYVDYNGAVVPNEVAEEQIRSFLRHPYGPAASDPASAVGGPTPAAALSPQQSQSDYNRLASRQGGFVNGIWVPPAGAQDGDYATGNIGAIKPGKTAGTVSVTLPNGQTIERAPMTPAEQHVISEQQANATYSALNVPQNTAQRTFILSQGPGGLAPTGIDMASLSNRQDNRQDLQLGPRGEYGNQPINSPQTQNARQYMSLQDAVQWFANLAATDKPAYNNMVAQLNRAGYFSSTPGNYLPTNALPLNGFSFPAGEAFARAALDLSVANAGGDNSDMLTWLQSRSQGYEDYLKSGAGFVPQSRAYQDPATLAASAKGAAQSALGRNLTPAEEAAFEAHFRQLENTGYDQRDASDRSRQIAQATGDTAGAGGGSYTLPDTTGQADQYVNGSPQFAQEKAGYSALEATKGLIQFIMRGQL